MNTLIDLDLVLDPVALGVPHDIDFVLNGQPVTGTVDDDNLKARDYDDTFVVMYSDTAFRVDCDTMEAIEEVF